MAFTLEEFARIRPYLFHLTAEGNLKGIARDRLIYPAQVLIERSGDLQWAKQKRRNHVVVEIEGEKISIRDQAPLHAGNMRLDAGWSFERFLGHLNRRVFFWPGRKDGMPIDYGRRHFERYMSEGPSILRLSTAELFSLNTEVSPEFARFNSGSPRWTYGNASPRGLDTFLRAAAANFRPSQSVEVTFPGAIKLPESTEISTALVGPWRRLPRER